MNMSVPVFLNWSSGKDAAMALHNLNESDVYSVERLVTTVSRHHQRVTMHGLRLEVLQRQLDAVGLPFKLVELPENASMQEYEQSMSEMVGEMKQRGISTTAFGDIFLEDLKAYREKEMQKLGIDCVFPLWKRDTRILIDEFVQKGFKALVVCVNGSLLDQSMVGRLVDNDFLNDLPDHIDPCGENGEFHTFCFDGPIFKHPVQFNLGKVVSKEYPNPSADEHHKNEDSVVYWFQDLI